jgi:hypothetical protein
MNFFRNNHEARRSKKAFRATELGIAGHQAAMEALRPANTSFAGEQPSHVEVRPSKNG